MKLLLILLVLHLVPLFGEARKYEDTDDDNGGPSSEFRPMGHKWSSEDMEYTPLRVRELRDLRKRSLEREPEKNPLIEDGEDEKFFDSLPGVLKKFEEDLAKLLSKKRIDGIVTGRIKSLRSLINKMKQDGVTDYHEITDIIGLRVTLQTIKDILRFKRSYEAFEGQITEIRCYGVCGPAVEATDPREKRYWPWKGSGYRRLHFKVAVPELKTEVEIQVGTPYMTLWAEWEHAVVYKGPEKLKNSAGVKSYAQKMANYYMMLDNIRSDMDPSCPMRLRKTRAKNIFSERDWKTFGSPRNACNFWNDLRVDMP